MYCRDRISSAILKLFTFLYCISKNIEVRTSMTLKLLPYDRSVFEIIFLHNISKIGTIQKQPKQ